MIVAVFFVFVAGLFIGVGSVAWAAFIIATGKIIPDFGFGQKHGPGDE